MIREPIYAALFAQLQKVAGIATCSRRLLHWADLDEQMQPAIFMTQGNQLASTQLKGISYKWDLDVKIWIYVRVPDEASPSPIINPILDQIEALIATVAGYKNTLGGLCDELIIDGSIETFEGTLGSQEVAIVPVKILVR